MYTCLLTVAVLDTCYERLKEDVLSFREKGKVVLLGDFNARVGKAADEDDVIGKFGEDTCNASGNKLIALLHEVELVACNGRQLVSEPEWTMVRRSLDQKSVIDYILMDEQLMAVSANVIVTDIGCSDHFFVWMEIGRFTKRGRQKRRGPSGSPCCTPSADWMIFSLQKREDDEWTNGSRSGAKFCTA